LLAQPGNATKTRVLGQILLVAAQTACQHISSYFFKELVLSLDFAIDILYLCQAFVAKAVAAYFLRSPVNVISLSDTK